MAAAKKSVRRGSNTSIVVLTLGDGDFSWSLAFVRRVLDDRVTISATEQRSEVSVLFRRKTDNASIENVGELPRDPAHATYPSYKDDEKSRDNESLLLLATSFDSRDNVIRRYPESRGALRRLAHFSTAKYSKKRQKVCERTGRRMGRIVRAEVLHGVDATNAAQTLRDSLLKHSRTDLFQGSSLVHSSSDNDNAIVNELKIDGNRKRSERDECINGNDNDNSKRDEDYGRACGKDALSATKMGKTVPLLFDLIIFNFPHSGTEDRPRHIALLRHFFASAVPLLRSPASILQLSLAGKQPERWRCVEAAEAAGLRLAGTSIFCDEAFPGYVRRRNTGGASFHRASRKGLYASCSSSAPSFSEAHTSCKGKEGQTDAEAVLPDARVFYFTRHPASASVVNKNDNESSRKSSSVRVLMSFPALEQSGCDTSVCRILRSCYRPISPRTGDAVKGKGNSSYETRTGSNSNGICRSSNGEISGHNNSGRHRSDEHQSSAITTATSVAATAVQRFECPLVFCSRSYDSARGLRTHLLQFHRPRLDLMEAGIGSSGSEAKVQRRQRHRHWNGRGWGGCC